jgi:hypothetical protein
MWTHPTHEDVDANGSNSESVQITVNYFEYTPSFQIEPIIRRMLDSVPQKYLNGLSAIVLTNSGGLPRKQRRTMTRSRKKKVQMAEARGLYHPPWQGREAWIEIYVDNVLRGWEKGLWLKLSFIRVGQLSDILFHEIGHHIHYTVRPEYREREDVADVWKVKLDRNYRRERHPLLGVVMRTLKRPLGYILNKSLKLELRKGWISQAEFDERMRHFRS